MSKENTRAELHKEVAELTAELETKQAELENTKQQMDNLMEEKDKQLEVLQAERDGAFNANKDLHEERVKLQDELKSNRDNCEQLKMSLKNAELSINNKNKDIEQLADKLEKNNSVLKYVTKRRDEESNACAMLRQDKLILEAKVERLTEERDHAKEARIRLLEGSVIRFLIEKYRYLRAK